MRRVLTAAVAALLLVTLAGCGGADSTNDGGYITGDGQVVEYSAAERTDPVQLSGTTLDGKKLDLADLHGKPTVVNIWWSNCPPCIKEAPQIQALHEKLGSKVNFVGVDIRDNSPVQGRAFERQFGITYPSLYSPDGQAVLAFSGNLSPRTVPATMVLDSQGRVASVVRGEIPSKTTLSDLVGEVTH